jgi:hypothetical protein
MHAGGPVQVISTVRVLAGERPTILQNSLSDQRRSHAVEPLWVESGNTEHV